MAIIWLTATHWWSMIWMVTLMKNFDIEKNHIFLPEGHHPLDGNLVDIDVRGDIVESVQLHFAALTYMLPKNHLNSSKIIPILFLSSNLEMNAILLVLVICAPPMLWILRVFFSKAFSNQKAQIHLFPRPKMSRVLDQLLH